MDPEIAGFYALGHEAERLWTWGRLERVRTEELIARFLPPAPGDARDLTADDASADAVLLLGPLYHLPQAADRDRALREARRVLRPGGVALAAAISYFAPTIDGIRNAKLDEPGFEAIVEHDLRGGLHRNPDGRPGWFTTAFFHRPEQLAAEVEAGGSRSRHWSPSKASGTTRRRSTPGSTTRRGARRSFGRSAASRPSPRCSGRARTSSPWAAGAIDRNE